MPHGPTYREASQLIMTFHSPTATVPFGATAAGSSLPAYDRLNSAECAPNPFGSAACRVAAVAGNPLCRSKPVARFASRDLTLSHTVTPLRAGALRIIVASAVPRKRLAVAVRPMSVHSPMACG